MVQLSPGMRLVYRTNFAGMYNDVSQVSAHSFPSASRTHADTPWGKVVYFHYPKFARTGQLELHDICKSSIHSLPLITQLLPDVPIVYDDDTHIPGLTAATAPGGTQQPPLFCWLVACGTVFLLEPAAKGIWASSDGGLIPMLIRVLKATLRMPTGEEGEGVGPLAVGASDPSAAVSSHSHVFLL